MAPKKGKKKVETKAMREMPPVMTKRPGPETAAIDLGLATHTEP